MTATMNRVLWVDVCGTLYDANTTAGFVRSHLARTGRGWSLGILKLLSSRKTPLRPSFILLGKWLGRDLLRDAHIAALKNEQRQTLEASVVHYCQQLAPKAIAPVHQLVAELRAKGWAPVLISNSLDIVVSNLASSMGIPSLASQLGFQDGICEGRLKVDLKGRKLEMFKISHPEEIEKENCAVITDNKSGDDLISASSMVFLVG
jgi:phosphoserine phosphatase